MMLLNAQFSYLQDLVKQHSAVVLDRENQELVESQLLPVAVDHGFRSLHQFLQHLQNSQINGVHQLVIESLIAEETSFFRDQQSFDVIKTKLLPELQTQNATERQLTIWCAGCSTGQEAYSLTMLLELCFPDIQDWKIRMIASDISQHRLARAQEGYYSQLEVNTGLPVSLMLRFFQKIGPVWQVKPELRKRIEFCHVNLAADWPPLPRIDLILVRNVLRYFDEPTKKVVLQKMAQTLQPGGYLCLGADETVDNLDSLYEPLSIDNARFYRSRAKAPPKRADGLMGKYDLAPAPSNVRKLAALLSNRDDGTIEEIIRVIDSDEALKVRLLQVANHGVTSGLGLVETVEEALMRAGMGSLLMLVMGDLVMRALKTTSSTMFSMDLEETRPAALETDSHGQLIGAARFSGRANGTVYIRFGHELGQQFAAHMTGIAAQDADADIVDEVAKEMANMVVGNFRSNLSDAGLRCKLDVPTVAHSQAFQCHTAPASQHQQLAFQHDKRMILVDLVIDSLG